MGRRELPERRQSGGAHQSAGGAQRCCPGFFFLAVVGVVPVVSDGAPDDGSDPAAPVVDFVIDGRTPFAVVPLVAPLVLAASVDLAPVGRAPFALFAPFEVDPLVDPAEADFEVGWMTGRLLPAAGLPPVVGLAPAAGLEPVVGLLPEAGRVPGAGLVPCAVRAPDVGFAPGAGFAPGPGLVAGLAPGSGLVNLAASLASSITIDSAAIFLSWIRCATYSWPNVQVLLESQ